MRNKPDKEKKKAESGSFAANTTTLAKARISPPTVRNIPTFVEWLKYSWHDIFALGFVGAVGLGVFFLEPAFKRSFAVTHIDGTVVFPSHALPLRKYIIPIWLSAFVSPAIPIIVFLAMQWRIRSFWDFNNAVTGMMYALVTGSTFHVFLKWFIGGLRPHFLEACQPDLTLASDQSIAMPGYSAGGFLGTYFTSEVCTGSQLDIKTALQSFPSGHTTAAFATLGFLYLYLNGKLKVFANYHPSFWKMVALYAPILIAILIGGTLTIDQYHNWYDIVAGGIIGCITALSAYRMTYASVFDWRYNHVPLSRSEPYTYGGTKPAGHVLDPGFANATWTHRAGWGNKSLGEGRVLMDHNVTDGAGPRPVEAADEVV